MAGKTVLLFPEQRRTGARRRMRTQWPAEIQFRDSALACTVADISPTGAKLRLFTVPVTGSRVWLSLERTAPIPAEIAWRRQSQIGLRFLAEQRWVAALQAACPFAWSR
jgi:hypothetical protein